MQQKNHLLVYGLIALILVAGLAFFFRPKSTTTIEAPVSNATSSPLVSVEAVKDEGSGSTPKSLWSFFQEYLTYAKNHDKAGLASLSYAVSDTCADPKQEKECFLKMDAVYVVGSKLKQNDFVNVMEDGKQAILSTNFVRIDSETELVATKAVIMFIKDEKGSPRLAALKPNEMWTVKRTSTSTVSLLEAKLQAMLLDTDKDGLTDEIEECVFPDNYIVFACEKTDPTKKDSNGNGYWDSFELYLSR